MESLYQCKLVSALTRVYSDEEPKNSSEEKLTALWGETVSFQMAYRIANQRQRVTASVSGAPGLQVQLRHVVSVPSHLPCYPEHVDDNYERTAPGLFPDVLRKLPEQDTLRADEQWRSLWVDVVPEEGLPAGEYTVSVTLTQLGADDPMTVTLSKNITVYAAKLPEQKLIHTRWFHADCLADYYHVPAFSEEHWKILESFIRTAANRGINMLLTPTFTQPLDTMVGGERTTVQLVEVTVENGKYTFGFDALKRWVDLCTRCGIRYFEIAHLFTQWGAKAAPKVMATVDGTYKRIFGWDTPATGAAYSEFLGAYLPALTAKLKEWGIADRCFFHISDEPQVSQLEDYLAAKELVAPYLKGFRMMDALSNYEFYETGAVQTPVCSSNHIETFLEHEVDPLWTYYCCSQGKEVSNVFFSMPLARARILGVQLYKFGYEGFLQWGFNFYNTQCSLEHISPFAVTDGGGAFPSGDAFIVYPGKDGEAEESLRLMAIDAAMNDLRALQMLESLTNREFVMDLVEGELEQPITMKQYPRSSAYLFRLRNRVNAEIAARI